MSLRLFHKPNLLEVGVDEAGRGPILGRLYAGAVIWPVDVTSSLIKDSKKFGHDQRGQTERERAYDFVIENAIAYGIAYVEPKDIGNSATNNIYASVMHCMHAAIDDTNITPQHIIVDGDHFVPYADPDGQYPSFTTVIDGDNTYYSVAAASILAKVEHDRYIRELCQQYPLLNRYDLLNNKGYGTAKHLQAIAQYGITQFHRIAFKCCQNLPITHI